MSETPNGILPDRFEKWFNDRCRYFTNKFSRLGLSPDSVTIFSLLFGLIAGSLLAANHFFLALVSGIFMGILDIIDGQLASLTGQTSTFGAVLDSTVDRYNESFLFVGLAVHYCLTGQPAWVFWVVASLVGSLMTSYVKARGEGMKLQCNLGLMQRSERLVTLGIGVIFQGWILKTVIVILTTLTHFTVVQRLLFMKKLSAKRPDNK